MSDTQVVIDPERVSTTEGEALRTERRFAGQPGSSNGKLASPPASAFMTIESESRDTKSRTEPGTTESPGSADSDPRLPGMVMRVVDFLFEVPILLFKGLREVYWALDRDAKVRSQGLQTIGRVGATKTEEHEDSESGTYYTHSVYYDFDIDDSKHAASKNVGSLGDLKRGVPIRVYYLPGTYPLASALDTQPRALGIAEKRGMAASPGPNRG